MVETQRVKEREILKKIRAIWIYFKSKGNQKIWSKN